ncbi:S41 family peptidase [Flammeovirga kamogawensis]|uniref:PDZ domain-containing protein n=1 Tax=Flammeovirga kamogawensis TaxID=373891 RepID=A0ABX8GXH4_9BACT|nr:S41 family peptidase [Flammeovirga kamogawensis]MBB6460901.1 C-terminal processing protease CtpA/Prc [Flammeovirga kamogawensis]QWG08246.1 hypothetical protein KM029_04725 [Flammeovirga kamogawensis]TRX70049.1 hypothetical protein EO216_18660 [Flammeovirga kamogawensis]
MFSLTSRKWQYILLFSLFSISCEKEENTVVPSTASNKEYLASLMDQWYLWYDQIPNINPDNYSTQNDMLVAMRYEKDKWSYIEDKAAYEAYYNSGQVTEGDQGAHGIYLKYYTENDLYIRYSYPGSSAANAGLSRGTKINQINGVDVSSLSSDEINASLGDNVIGVTNTFGITIPARMTYENGVEVISQPAKDTTIVIAKEAVVINPILHSEIITTPNNVKVGHVVFKSFIEPAVEPLNNLFADFKAKGVSEVVLDMRYNGGGRVSIASQLASILAPSSAKGKDLFRYRHNDKQLDQNEDEVVEIGESNLNLDRLFILTTDGTASSSELMINGLKPFMDIQVIGLNTYGKPVGSYGFENNGFIYSVISLKILNANDEGEYFDGLPTNQDAEDNVLFHWGDIREPMLHQALYMIQNGSYDQSASTARMRFDEVSEMKNKSFKLKEDREIVFDQILEIK